MLIEQIEFANFKSFRGEHAFDFRQCSPGLHFVAGENLSEPNLEANGAGKSTLWDAIYWTLYGRTVRGLRAAAVRSWGARGATVGKLAFRTGGSLHRLERSWSPNRLRLDGEDTLQETIERVVGLSADEFSYAVFASQFGDMFFDLTPADKLSVFTKLLDLDFWLDRSRRASQRAVGLESDLQEKERERSRIEGSMEQIKVSLSEAEERIKAFEEKRRERIAALKKERKAVEEKTGSLEDEQAALRKQMTAATHKFNKAADELEEIDESREALEEKAAEKGRELAVLESSHSRSAKELKKFETVEGICPYCKQEVDEDHLEREIKALQRELRDIEKERDRVEAIREQFAGDRMKLHGRTQALEESQHNLERIIQSSENKLAECQSELKQVERDLKRFDNELVELKEEENPYELQREELQDKLSLLEEKHEATEALIADISRRHQAVSYWTKGFKEVRLFVVEESLKQLEVEVNSNLVQLGLSDWTVTFDVERETKSGGVSKGFQVFILSPDNAEPVPWAAWSGGESQRLRLAGTLGLSDMILNKKGIACNLEIYDEPTAHLSQSGIDDLLEALYLRAINTKKQIWLVDHRSLDYGNFASTLKIVKDEEGSRICQ